MNLNKGERWLRGRIRHRLHDSQLNWLAVWVGPPGSGKSWSALRVAELIDDSFSWDRGSFDVGSVLESVWEKTPPRGSVVMLDEAGLAVDSRRWFEHANRALAYMVESFRYLGLAFLMTVPDPSFIDRVPRSLFNMSFECIRVDLEKEHVVVRPYFHQVNPRLHKVYHKQPRIHVPGKGRVKIVTMRFQRPSADLTATYEEARHRYMQDFHGELIRMGREMQVEKLTMKDRAGAILESLADLSEEERTRFRNTRGFYDADLIQMEYNTSRSIARAVSKILGQD